VVLLPAGTAASGEVRGGAPGTREWALLEPGRMVDKVSAVVLTGGSAFGLSACDGVVRWCEERGIGWPTASGPVPIVVGMVIYDLGVGDSTVRPGPAEGFQACVSARAGDEALGTGLVGAGTGATVGKWKGADASRPAGLGSAVARDGELVVSALMVVNATGDPLGDASPRPRLPDFSTRQAVQTEAGVEATTIGLIVTNAVADKTGCLRLAQSGHDGMARALDPVHTAGDGDALVAAATGEVEAPLERVRLLAAWVVEQAILDALGSASS
jgi:L-aminopeptidase/D-esterase-like protein